MCSQNRPRDAPVPYTALSSLSEPSFESRPYLSPWLTAGHPDPDRWHLGNLVRALRAFVKYMPREVVVFIDCARPRGWNQRWHAREGSHALCIRAQHTHSPARSMRDRAFDRGPSCSPSRVKTRRAQTRACTSSHVQSSRPLSSPLASSRSMCYTRTRRLMSGASPACHVALTAPSTCAAGESAADRA